jgi:hypothetical protein
VVSKEILPYITTWRSMGFFAEVLVMGIAQVTPYLDPSRHQSLKRGVSIWHRFHQLIACCAPHRTLLYQHAGRGTPAVATSHLEMSPAVVWG